MKTLEHAIYGHKSDTLDGRDLYRLARFVPADKLHLIKVTPEPGSLPHVEEEFTRENVLKQLEKDLDFAFDKALGKRGISASLMYAVIKMWNWILEEGLEDFSDSNYAQYGLPLLKATAVKYGFPNPIGDDAGNEWKYSDQSDYDE